MSDPRQYFTEKILPCRHRMYAAALAITGSEDAAADIVQNVLLACWEHVAAGETIEKPMAYCLAAVRNRSIDEFQRLSRLSPIDDAPEQVSQPVDTDASDLSAAMALLSPREQTAIRMSADAGCSSQEISEALHISSANARQILSRARRRLREFFNDPNS